ncbi:MAG TPA: hypothetical protein VN720_02850 [Rudaea sp.]|nr:hypothetical protein [Rudaea sp.]
MRANPAAPGRELSPPLAVFLQRLHHKTAFLPDRVDDGRSVRGGVVDFSQPIKTWRLVIHD